MKTDSNVHRILEMDGVDRFCMNEANQEVVHVPGIIDEYDQETSWCPIR
jgi:hypothetical protein